MSDDFCVVCAEPLEWVAYAACGHKETCSKCVARLRVVLEDSRCVLCQQSGGAVVVTRYSGSYTATVPAAEFPSLQVRQCDARQKAACWKAFSPRALCRWLSVPSTLGVAATPYDRRRAIYAAIHQGLCAFGVSTNIPKAFTAAEQARAEHGNLKYLKAADAYFDDEQHYNTIRQRSPLDLPLLGACWICSG